MQVLVISSLKYFKSNINDYVLLNANDELRGNREKCKFVCIKHKKAKNMLSSTHTRGPGFFYTVDNHLKLFETWGKISPDT